jgi:hypothetical protein
LGRANQIGLNASIFKDPNRVNTRLKSLQAVTPADVQRVAQKYLVTTNRSVVITQPAPKPIAVRIRRTVPVMQSTKANYSGIFIMTTAAAAAAAGTITAQPAAAQTPPPAAAAADARKSTVLKGKAPVSQEVLSVQLPKPKEYTLKSSGDAGTGEQRCWWSRIIGFRS